MSVALLQDKKARRTLFAIGKSGRYNPEKKNIDGSWVVAFREGMERFSGKAHVVTEEDKCYVERMRKKCTSTSDWNYERVYKLGCQGADPLKLFQQPAEPIPRNTSQEMAEKAVHSQFTIAADVKLIGRRQNISPLASDDDNLYYIAKGSVMCSGVRETCRCSEGCIRVMVVELFPHDSPLQRAGIECREEMVSNRVIQVENPLEWHQSLVRLIPKENIRKNAKPNRASSKRGGKENQVRKSTRKSKYSSKIIEIINNGALSKQIKVGAKRGRKRKGGAIGRTIEASKPVTSVVERPGKRRSTKLALK
jgi:hypothetical protein